MRKNTKLLLAMGVLLTTAPALTGCYTTRGAGDDLQAAGRGISNSADKHSTYNP